MPAFQDTLSRLPESVQRVVEEVVKRVMPSQIILFGSRARGDHRDNSDFDLALKGRSCSDDQWNRLLVDLRDEPLTLYSIDLVESELLSEDYLANIKSDGRQLYG